MITFGRLTPPKRTYKQLAVLLLFRCVVVPLITPFVWGYKLLVGWWLDPLSARRNQEELRGRVQAGLSFLFDDFGYQFVPNDREYPRGMDFAIVTFVSDKLRFRAARDRGEDRLDVAPLCAPDEWEDVRTALTVRPGKHILPENDNPKTLSYISLADLAPSLKRELPHLEQVFSTENYSETVVALDKSDEISRQKFIARFNKNAKFYRDHPEFNPWKKKQRVQTLALKDGPEGNNGESQ